MSEETSIDEIEFGYIIIDRKEHGDVYIFSDGTVEARDRGAVRAKYNTSHVVDAEEIKKLVENRPSALIIATGFSGCLKVHGDVKELCKNKGVHLIEVHTSHFKKTFEEHPGPKAALVHVTC